MREMMMAACAAGMVLCAGAADAATWTFSGVSGDPTGATVTGLEQGTTYYFQLESAATSNIGFQQHSRVWLYWSSGVLDGQLADQYNLNTILPFQLTSFGAVGSFLTPQNDDNGFFRHEYDELLLWFYPPHGAIDVEPVGTPWTLTVSDAPIAAPGSVPEPATWAMMIAGFGLVGSTLRRRRLALA